MSGSRILVGFGIAMFATLTFKDAVVAGCFCFTVFFQFLKIFGPAK